MDRESLLKELGKKPDAGAYCALAAENQELIPLLLSIIEEEKGSVKFLCEKIIRRLSEERPEALYPYFDRMAGLIHSQNSFIKYGFILTMPNLLPVDREGKWEKLTGLYVALLDTEAIPVFGNALSGLSRVLAQYPAYEKTVLPKLLGIDGHVFLHKNQVSPECVNVAKGHILDFFSKTYERSGAQKEMRRFAEENLLNPRNQVRVKARAFLKKYGGGK